jgi:uncharacterized protein (DUF362 family)
VAQPEARVTILQAGAYNEDLFDLLRRGLQDYPAVLARVRGGRVVLKPNIVDHYATHPVNTHPVFIATAVAVFRHFGAAEVIVAEGPGHRRDTEMLLELSGVGDALRQEKVSFIDLNLDAISPVSLAANYTQLGRMFFPNTILGADLVVSLPKLKTHHWSGVTLSLKNMFGTVPGVKYGWPKNLLHWRGIAESIIDINTTLQPGFAIVDGIEGMEGDGPLHGEAISSGVIVMGDNLTAVDATAARIMGVYPENIDYLMYMMASFGGTLNEHRIEQLGESLDDVRQDFRVLDHMAFIKRPFPLSKKLLLLGW